MAGLQKGSLGVNVQQEVVAMVKSQQYSSEKMLANAAATHEMFRVYDSGDMSMDELKTQLSELGGKSTKDLAKFEQRIRDNGGSTVNKDIQGELSSIVDEGLGTVYGLSKMQSDSRNVSEFAEDTVDGIMSMFGIAHKPRDKQALRPEVKKQLSDMMTISVAGDKSMDAVQSALTGFEQVNFKELQSSIEEFGVSEGVNEYLTTSGIADNIGSDGAFKLSKSLKGGEGDRKQTLKHLERQAQVGRSIKSAGIDVNSILNTIGFGVSGGMTVQQIDALGKELEYAGTQKRLHDHEEGGGGHGNRHKVVERRVKGITQSLMKHQGMSRDEAIEYQHAVGAQIRQNKEALAVFSQAP
ncbi:MAG TPA: hypothetical protein EYP39_06860, partial [Ghiorsea sp.]|nr:hypothetical protein [Ghiorsea sp.]